MKTLYTFLLAILVTANLVAQDTFSIIAVDPVTGDIGSAGASCVTGVGAAGIIDIITDIIPGRGGVNSQAYVCIPNTNLQNAIAQMEAGSSPSEIIDYLLMVDLDSELLGLFRKNSNNPDKKYNTNTNSVSNASDNSISNMEGKEKILPFIICFITA